MTRQTILSMTAAIIFAAGSHGLAGSRDSDDASIQQFRSAVRTYAALHRRIEKQLPPFRVMDHGGDIVESSNALAAALQTARAKAREGDFFTTAVAVNFRLRIAEALAARQILPDEVVADSVGEAPADAPMPFVNGRFPWARGAATWPCIIEALPGLPDELQYRIVGRDLVLVDTHAGLVVDILRNAIR